MGSGASGIKGGGGGGAAIREFDEAFKAGKDFEAVNGVDHDMRTVSRTTQAEWDNYVAGFGSDPTATEEYDIMRQYSSIPNAKGAVVSGYIRTQNSFAINEALYDPANAGKSIDQIFTRSSDKQTIKTLDRLIDTHSTPADASYTRFCSANALKNTFGFSDAQMAIISNAPNMTKSELAQLNKALSGSTSYNASYTSVSANRSLNAFKNPNASHSSGMIFERKISTPKGTKAFAAKKNAQESEVIFGRNAETAFGRLSVASDGHIVFHEGFTGYRK